MKERTNEHAGHVVNWFTLGDASKAQEVTIQYMTDEHAFIKYTCETEEIEHSFDCSEGRYHEKNRIPGYWNHKGSNQMFVVNEDQTISPTYSREVFWGLSGEERKGGAELILVKKDSPKKFIFDTILSSALAG
jgi:hypothetical protein